MTEHFPPPILNYITLASLHTPATTSTPTHQLPFSPASPPFMSPLQLPPPSPLSPCATLHQSSLHQASLNHFCDKTNSEADCGPGFCSSHKNTAKFKMRSSHKNTANYDQDSSHKNTVPHRPCISCRHSLSPSSPISPRQWLSLSLTSPLQASPYPALAQSHSLLTYSLLYDYSISNHYHNHQYLHSPTTVFFCCTSGMSLHRQSLSPSPSPPCTFPPISITPRQSPSLMSPSNHLFPSTTISPNTPHHNQPHHHLPQGEMTWRAA